MANVNTTEELKNQVIAEATVKPEENAVQQNVAVQEQDNKLILSDEEVKLIMQHREEEAKKAEKKGIKITKKKVIGGLAAGAAVIGAILIGRASKQDQPATYDNNDNYVPRLPDNNYCGDYERQEEYVDVEAEPTTEEF